MKKYLASSRLITALNLIVLCYIMGCRSFSNRTIIFPDRDIVYQANEGENYQLGFVNEDGTDVVLYSTKIRLSQPVWSPDKNTIFFRTIVRENPGIDSQSRSGYIGMLKTSDIPRGICEDMISPTDRLVPTHDDHVILVSDATTLGFIDLGDCKWRKVITKNDDGFCSYALSSDETTILYSEVHANKCMIKSMNLETDVTNSLGEGRSASFSPDNNMIAFIRPEGIYLMDRNGENINELIHFRLIFQEYRNYYDIPTTPAWSPDGKWIVYHKCTSQDGLCDTTSDFQVFKLRVSDRQETLLVEHGLNPDWR